MFNSSTSRNMGEIDAYLVGWPARLGSKNHWLLKRDAAKNKVQKLAQDAPLPCSEDFSRHLTNELPLKSPAEDLGVFENRVYPQQLPFNGENHCGSPCSDKLSRLLL